MKTPMALAALFISACGGSTDDPITPPTVPPPNGPIQVDGGEWGQRSGLLQPQSEFALAESNGKLYVLGGYPPSRITVRTVQIYDIATDSWQLGPQLPLPNNHGMAAAVNGKIYLIGGQLTADQEGYVNTVYELDPAVGAWVEKARMPTARSGGVAVVHDGRIFVAGGRLPRGSDFAVYDPAADLWEVLPDLPTQRNHISGAAIGGRIHIVGGRLGNVCRPSKRPRTKSSTHSRGPGRSRPPCCAAAAASMGSRHAGASTCGAGRT